MGRPQIGPANSPFRPPRAHDVALRQMARYQVRGGRTFVGGALHNLPHQRPSYAHVGRAKSRAQAVTPLWITGISRRALAGALRPLAANRLWEPLPGASKTV
jgi:hypothetical protein